MNLNFYFFFSQLVFRPFHENLKIISKTIEDFIFMTYESDKRVQQQPFNSFTIITYIHNMAISEHRDQDFNKDGSFDKIKNSQIEDTVTAILCIGDPRRLDFTLHKTTPGKIEKICKYKSFDLTHGSLFVLHPNDEKPLVRQICQKNETAFFKHSCKGVAKGQMSLGIVFRSVSHFCQVDKSTGCAISDESDGFRTSKADKAVIKYLDSVMKEEDERYFSSLWNICKNKHFI